MGLCNYKCSVCGIITGCATNTHIRGKPLSRTSPCHICHRNTWHNVWEAGTVWPITKEIGQCECHIETCHFTCPTARLLNEKTKQLAEAIKELKSLRSAVHKITRSADDVREQLWDIIEDDKQ